MSRRLLWFIICVLIVVLFYRMTRPRPAGQLWPKNNPYKTGYFKVSELHELYYELYGNKKGLPVVVLHGGPGGNITPYYRRFFDPDQYHVLLFDQRGAGKSKPHAALEDNTTWHLVEDIEKLRNYVNMQKIILWGGSWGSTLALAYAETYPQHVSGMILRGIFLGTDAEIDHFYHGGVEPFFPELYQNFVSEIPELAQKGIPEKLHYLISSDEPHLTDKFSRLWTRYEYKLAMLNTPQKEVDNVERMDLKEVLPFALFENYYMMHRCFLEENQLLEHVDVIKNIPTVLINGRYDMICPPVNAYRLYQKMNRCDLIIVENAGHWMGDEPLEKALVKATDNFPQLLEDG